MIPVNVVIEKFSFTLGQKSEKIDFIIIYILHASEVDKVEPEFGGLEKPEGMIILQVLDKLEDVSDALLSRLDSFSFITE